MKETKDWEHLPEFGSWVCLWEGTLIETPAPLVSNFDDWYEVTAPDSQAYLDAVNNALDTNFTMDQFAGR